MATKEQSSTARDPICGMSVDVNTARQATRDGETFYFCCEHCRNTFLSSPDGVEPTVKSGHCCG